MTLFIYSLSLEKEWQSWPRNDRKIYNFLQLWLGSAVCKSHTVARPEESTVVHDERLLGCFFSSEKTCFGEKGEPISRGLLPPPDEMCIDGEKGIKPLPNGEEGYRIT